MMDVDDEEPSAPPSRHEEAPKVESDPESELGKFRRSLVGTIFIAPLVSEQIWIRPVWSKLTKTLRKRWAMPMPR